MIAIATSAFVLSWAREAPGLVIGLLVFCLPLAGLVALVRALSNNRPLSESESLVFTAVFVMVFLIAVPMLFWVAVVAGHFVYETIHL
jgi:hypothetical protein